MQHSKIDELFHCVHVHLSLSEYIFILLHKSVKTIMQRIQVPLCLFLALAILAGIEAAPTTEKSGDDINSNSVNPESKDDLKPLTTFAPEIADHVKPGVTVARIIDDIFQIPIGVLQSVAKLLRNPFVQHYKTPETVSTY